MMLDISRPPFKLRNGSVSMFFIGHDIYGNTVWQYPTGEIRTRRADGRMYADEESDLDIINAPHQPRIAYVTVYADGAHARVIGLVYPSKELAELYAKADKRVVRIAQIELPEGVNAS